VLQLHVSGHLIQHWDIRTDFSNKEIYRDKDKPYYYTGNKVLISICAASVVVILTHRGILRHINRSKKKAWDKLSEAEQRDYDRIQGSRMGNKSLTFGFSY
jgi:hypothetical protein